jgi:diacylglycerol kinase family enzyme
MSGEQFHVLINSGSGTASKFGAEKIEQLIKEGPLNLKSFNFLAPEEFNTKLRELLEGDAPIMVGGGDGTIAKSAALHLEKKKPFAILPFGTMNLLAQDLRVPLAFPENLTAYQKTRTIDIDVGDINGHPFLCCAAWGTMPESAVLREEYRDVPKALLLPRLTAFIIQQMDKAQKRRIKLTLDGKARRIHTAMLVISNNVYDPDPAEDPFKKASLKEEILGVYSIKTPSLFDKARLLFHIARGDWLNDPSVRRYYARNVVLETGKSKELISIDGEPLELTAPFKFKLLPKALKIIVPVSG